METKELTPTQVLALLERRSWVQEAQRLRSVAKRYQRSNPAAAKQWRSKAAALEARVVTA